MIRFFFCAVFAVTLGACATTTATKNPAAPPQATAAQIDNSGREAPADIPAPTPPEADPMPAPSFPGPIVAAPVVPTTNADAFAALPYWTQADVRPALHAYIQSCRIWAKKNSQSYLSPNRTDLGRIADWQAGCEAAKKAEGSARSARAFFEDFFYPLILTASEDSTGLITGYYQPELAVSPEKTAVYSEPILTVPASEAARRLPRSEISDKTSDVIAYGKPLDVFFMQVQGSGVLRFPDGHRLRAAYAGNNGHEYTSIGKVLIRWGGVSKDKASMQDLEDWMIKSGPEAAQKLMNENQRYIFFRAQELVPGEGPDGGMRVPLTDMGSLAVDTSHHPYGVPIWLTVKLPQEGGDYKGLETGQLLIAQDTGKAIRGPFRGDVYFGSGFEAGELAGVMKHQGQWTVLIPSNLIRRTLIS